MYFRGKERISDPVAFPAVGSDGTGVEKNSRDVDGAGCRSTAEQRGRDKWHSRGADARSLAACRLTYSRDVKCQLRRAISWRRRGVWCIRMDSLFSGSSEKMTAAIPGMCNSGGKEGKLMLWEASLMDGAVSRTRACLLVAEAADIGRPCMSREIERSS